MTHTLIHRLLTCASAGFVLAGILTLGTTTVELVQADLTGHGTLVTELHPSPSAEVVYGIAAAQAGADVQLALGMLFVLAGMGFYALSVVRSQPIRGMRTHLRRRKLGPNKSLRTLRVRSA